MSTFIVGSLILLLGWTEGNNADFDPVVSSECEHFTLNLPAGPTLPSEKVYVNASCSTSSGNASLICPNWNVINDLNPKASVFQNYTVVESNTCTRYTSVYMWILSDWRNKSKRFNLEFKYPLGVPVKQITFERSGNGGRCQREEEDCWIDGQECDHWWKTCRCLPGSVFVEKENKCFFSVSTLFGDCSYSEQCKGLGAVCDGNKCKHSESQVADRCLNKELPCENFTVNFPVGPSLPSEAVFFNASCSTSSGCGSQVCPDWNVGILDFWNSRDYILHNGTVVENNTCVRYNSVHVWKPTQWKNKFNQITIQFKYPPEVPAKQINIEKSANGERCKTREDCWLDDQECCPLTRTCRCPRKQVFVEDRWECVLAVSTLFGSCSYSEQCRDLGAICESKECKCPVNHLADLVHNRCLYTARESAASTSTTASHALSLLTSVVLFLQNL